MKAYKRVDFIKLPENTIYSKINKEHGELMCGLFCKTSGEEFTNDWVEQDLISEHGFPNEIMDGGDALDYQLNLRDTYQEFQTDLHCGGRDGLYEDSDVFVVWDKKDVSKLRDYLNDVLDNNTVI
jgi:hypothetical protein